MDTIILFIAGIAALSGLLAVMIYLLAVSREMQPPDIDEVWYPAETFGAGRGLKPQVTFDCPRIRWGPESKADLISLIEGE